MEDEKSGQCAVGLNGEDRVCKAVLDRIEDIGDGAEEPLELIRIELECAERSELSSFQAAIAEGR
jgi:hypothetical protein